MSTPAERVDLVQRVGEALMRHGEYDLAVPTLALALELRYENAPPVFACDVDESAGLAEVHELHAHSCRVDLDGWCSITGRPTI